MNQSRREEITWYKRILAKDYRPPTIRSYSKILERFLEWKQANDPKSELSLEVSLLAYIDPNNAIANRIKDLKSIRAAIHLYYRHLTGTPLRFVQEQANNPFVETELDAYVDYLREVSGYADATLFSHRSYLSRLLYSLFPGQAVEHSMISAVVVRNFMATEMKCLRPSSKKRVLGILRSYIRYLQFKGIPVNSALLELPLQAPVWRLSHIPETLQQEQIANILASYDQTTKTGIRDFAIAVCFTELGLRASEVANLSLGDLNWREGKIRIKQTKTRVERELPLPRRVGEAIIRYLQESRPKTDERTVFVRFSHHCGEAMGREQIRGTMRRAYARVGISPSVTGTHILRHSKAKIMYESGSSLKMIADVLGHESMDTTKIYTKVSYSALHAVVGSWPTLAVEADHG